MRRVGMQGAECFHTPPPSAVWKLEEELVSRFTFHSISSVFFSFLLPPPVLSAFISVSTALFRKYLGRGGVLSRCRFDPDIEF